LEAYIFCTRDNVLALGSDLGSDSMQAEFSLVSLNTLLGCNIELFFDVKKKETKANNFLIINVHPQSV